MRIRPTRVIRGMALWLAVVGLLWYAAKDLDWRAVSAVLGQLTLLQISLLLALNTAIVVLLGARWRLILKGQGYSISFPEAVGYRLAAFGASYFTPGPHAGGEPLQVVLASRRGGIPLVSATTSVALDRLLDLAANFAFLSIGIFALIWRIDLPARLGGAGLSAALGLSILPVAYLVSVSAGRKPISALMRGLPFGKRINMWNRISFLIAAAESEAVALIRDSWGVFILTVLSSAVIWAALILEYFLAVQYLGLDLHPWDVIAIIASARIAIYLPMPAGLGALEAAFVLAALSLGESAAFGASLSVLVRSRDTLFGVIGLLIGQRSLNNSATKMEIG